MPDRRTSLAIPPDFPPPERWRWVSRYEHEPLTVIPHRAHALWMKRHQETHTTREIMICLSGTHFYGFRGKVCKATPGTVFLIEKGDSHDAIYSRYHPECRDLWLHLSQSHSFGVNDVTVHHEAHRDSVCQTYYLVSHARTFVDNVHLAWNRLNEAPHDLFRYHHLKTNVTAIILETLLYGIHPTSSPRKEVEQRQIVEQIKNYIHANLAQKLSLNRLAELAGYDPIYFHRIFSRHAGESVLRFINNARLKKAKTLLLEGYKIVSIADALGFTSSSYFCRFFKRETQLTPSAWLQKATKGEFSEP